MFLVQFEVRTGYEIVWSKSVIDGYDFSGLDFKVLPSGIHEFDKATVLVSHLHSDKVYYGLGTFRQHIVGQNQPRQNNQNDEIDGQIQIEVHSENDTTKNENDENNNNDGVDSKTVNRKNSANGPVDRSTVKVYSLGIICDPATKESGSRSGSGSGSGFGSVGSKTMTPLTSDSITRSSESWKPNEFISNGWEYIEVLDSTLVHFLQTEQYDNFDIFNQLYDRIVVQKLSSEPHLPVSSSSSRFLSNSSVKLTPNVHHHLLTKLPQMFKTVGPFIFALYKQSLLRKRIIFFAKNHRHHLLDKESIENDSDSVENDIYFNHSAFTYLLSLISVIPHDIETVSKDEKKHSYSQPIYNIGLNDLDSDDLLKTSGYIASTSDDILMFQRDLYDIGVILDDSVTVYNHSDIKDMNIDDSKRIRATIKDYKKFKLIYKPISCSRQDDTHHTIFTNNTNISTDDLNSLYTAASVETSANPDEYDDILADSGSVYVDEPKWWLDYATEPISWRESIWQAFSWFASAGQVDSDSAADTATSATSLRKTNLDLFELIKTIGYFHKLTKKWFYLVNEIITEQLDDLVPQGESLHGRPEVECPHGEDDDEVNTSLLSSLTSSSKIRVELTYQDIVDMELDPYSEADLQFVREFVLLYWGSVVDSVEIGIGFTSICC
ncbi:hypothetical protein G9P44_000937 [Scheffersomyces stipitis]|nr:hypothetical protein G9P44_000937 [Scheffersomyces stipitis]